MKKKVLAKYDEDIEGPQETVSSPLNYLRMMFISCQGVSIGFVGEADQSTNDQGADWPCNCQ